MENSPYMEAVSALRSIKEFNDDEQAVLEGKQLISIEAIDEQETTIVTYIQENFAAFMQAAQSLSAEMRELVLIYYLLSKPQTLLGNLTKNTQTSCSFRLRQAVGALCCYLTMGRPTQEQLRECFERNGFENQLTVPLSKLAYQYDHGAGFAALAITYNLHRPDIRRTLRLAQTTLDASIHPVDRSIASHLYCLLDGVSPMGKGLSKRNIKKKHANIQRKDPDCVGEFRIKVEGEGFSSMFMARANR